MTGHRPFSELTANLRTARKERIRARASELRAEMALAELRQARALSQGELARVLGVKQPAVAWTQAFMPSVAKEDSTWQMLFLRKCQNLSKHISRKRRDWIM